MTNVTWCMIIPNIFSVLDHHEIDHSMIDCRDVVDQYYPTQLNMKPIGQVDIDRHLDRIWSEIVTASR